MNVPVFFTLVSPLLLMIFNSFLVLVCLCKALGDKRLGANGCACEGSDPVLFLCYIMCVSRLNVRRWGINFSISLSLPVSWKGKVINGVCI